MQKTDESYIQQLFQSFIEWYTCNHAVMWRIHNSSGKFPSLTTTVGIWHDEWITRLLVLFYFNLFQTFSHAHGKLPFGKAFSHHNLSIPQGRVYQQLHLRDLIKGAPSVKPWETVSTIWYVSSTIQHFFLKLLMLVIITFFFLGFVFKFISSFLWSSFWHDMDLPKYIFVQTSKILYLYLVKLLKSWPT